jgi:hypothetical protein
VCLLLPDAVEPPALLLETLESEIEQKRAPNPWACTTLALAACRHDEAEKALRLLDKARQSEGYARNQSIPALALSLRAMTEHQRGQAEEANKALAEATSLVEEHLPKLAAGELGGWHDWLIAEILRREAAGRLAEPSDGATPEANVPATERSR